MYFGLAIAHLRKSKECWWCISYSYSLSYSYNFSSLWMTTGYVDVALCCLHEDWLMSFMHAKSRFLPLTAASAWSMLLSVSRRRDELRRSCPLLPLFIRKILVSYFLTILSQMWGSPIPSTVTIFFRQTLFVYAPGRVSTMLFPFITRFTSTSALRRPGWSASSKRLRMVPVKMIFACSSLASSGLSMQCTRAFNTELSSASSTAVTATVNVSRTAKALQSIVAHMATPTVSCANLAAKKHTFYSRTLLSRVSRLRRTPVNAPLTTAAALSLVKGAGNKHFRRRSRRRLRAATDALSMPPTGTAARYRKEPICAERVRV